MSHVLDTTFRISLHFPKQLCTPGVSFQFLEKARAVDVQWQSVNCAYGGLAVDNHQTPTQLLSHFLFPWHEGENRKNKSKKACW